MKFEKSEAEALVPDGGSLDAALARTTHMGIGAHQDDLEIMAVHGILQCFARPDLWFTGVTCGDGAGSPRAGVYAAYTNDEMKSVRREEQRIAARIGRYSAIVQLAYASPEIKDPADGRLVDDLVNLLEEARPRIVYTHNPADKHPTHTAVVMKTLAAIRRLRPEARPQKVLGCEVWRDLDWLPDKRKVALDVSGRDNLKAALLGVYDSQIAGGKRYDLAAVGRQRANATYFEAHGVDTAESVVFALNLTPFIQDDNLDVMTFLSELIDEFRNGIRDQLSPLM